MIKKNVEEFKSFIARGNVIDLAVGVIIGGAFSAIVTSLVDNILTPILGLVLGGIDFSDLAIQVGDATIKYGVFIQNIIDFLIVAFCIFTLIKFLNKLTHKKEKDTEVKSEVKEVVPVKSEIEILEEIRDLLKQEKTKKIRKLKKEA